MNARPHYHALIFNLGFPDKTYWKTTKSGEKIYVSPLLDRLWGFGFSSVGDVTFGSAAYVARYHVKKAGSVVSNNNYINPNTGEILAPEYVTMSRGAGKKDPDSRFRGGIGRGWFDKYYSDVYPQDARVIKGVDTKPCKFYDTLYEAQNPDGFREIKLDRMVQASALRDDNTPERLEVKEKVKMAQISKLKTEDI